MKINKLKAFTLIEVIIVLIISSTVITLAFWSYLNIYKYLETYRENEGVNQELALFLHHFEHDIDKCNIITVDNGYLQLKYNKEGVIEYDFYEDQIIRYFFNYPDTFKVGVVYFNYISEPLNEDFIKEVELTLKISGVEYPMIFYKFFSNQELYNWYEELN